MLISIYRSEPVHFCISEFVHRASIQNRVCTWNRGETLTVFKFLRCLAHLIELKSEFQLMEFVTTNVMAPFPISKVLFYLLRRAVNVIHTDQFPRI